MTDGPQPWHPSRGAEIIRLSGHYSFCIRYSGVVIVTTDGCLVLQRRDRQKGTRNPGRISLFGGVARLNESGRQAAARELREELGLLVTMDELIEIDRFETTEDDRSTTRCRYYLLTHPVHPEDLSLGEGDAIVYLRAPEALAQPHLTDAARRTLSRWAGSQGVDKQ
jgi:8-oxo-dGTP pyrophosphatase MutT (NUDIX family)